MPQLADAPLILSPPEGNCRVVEIIDEDTVDMHCPGEDLLRVRITGFDSPELHSPACASEAAAAPAAKWHLRRILWSAGGSSRFAGEDRHGRRLAELRADGEGVSERMIGAGHGRPYDGGPRGGWCAA